MLQTEMFQGRDDHRLLPIVHKQASEGVPTYIWDIPYTINQLSYLTHSHYRYYGKFPSSVAAQILEQHYDKKPHTCVYDHFCGSGTTLVEAKLRRIPSYGLDISWIAALVSNVKVRHIDLNALRTLSNKIATSTAAYIPPDTSELDAFASKWFSLESTHKMQFLRERLRELPSSPERDFLLVGFLGIVRRVSKAFDGEVRPHINAEKKSREVFRAFRKKIVEMASSHADFQAITKRETSSICRHGNNTEDTKLDFERNDVSLVISHPPYLNSFNYRPVFSLEFYWARPFEAEYSSGNASHSINNELVAHPANDDVTEKYFDHLKQAYVVAHDLLIKRGKLAIVIGDCTRNGVLIPVIERVVSICADIGLRLVERNYRTTHYGLGKYAYKHRADYHGDGEEKRDGILVFQKR